MFRRKQKPAPDAPKVEPAWEPPADPVFQYLVQQGLFGTLNIWYAAISPARLVRFDPVFRPERTPEGEAVVADIMARWRAGDVARMCVYPKGDTFIVADDYFTLAAIEQGQPDRVPCWVLGEPGPDAAHNIQGPLDQLKMRRLFGVA